VSFRIIGQFLHIPAIFVLFSVTTSDSNSDTATPDKAAAPLIAGRADGVQPRFLETLHSWGLADEVHEEGPLIERTAIYKDGKKLLFNRSHQSDSRYRGLHIITQGQIERIYIRDLLRHKKLVERETTVLDFTVAKEEDVELYPIKATLRNEKTGGEETVRAKFLIGSDGAASSIRKQLQIPFDGVSTDIYWGIMDCVFESDYPHAWVFGYGIPRNPRRPARIANKTDWTCIE
jgi:phenol 2-monooxygenase